MDLTIKLSDLGLILLWTALLVLIVYLIIILKRFGDTMKEIQYIFAQNKENIEKTLTEMPSIAKNVDEITSEVSHDVKTVRSTIDTISGKGEAAATSLGGTGDLLTSVVSMVQVFVFAKNFLEKTFSKRRRVI